MRFGVVGNGVVGRATTACFPEACEGLAYDSDPSRSTARLIDVLRCDIVFVCLPTPQKPGALACDTSAIDKFLCSVDDLDTNIVLRSTVPVGYTRKARHRHGLVNLIHWPDFHTERLNDAATPSRIVLGGPICDCRTTMCKLVDRRWPNTPKFVLNSDESEAVKLIQNSFSAVKVAFFNEVKSLVTPDVLSALLAGGWINPMHTKVPGPDGRYGFGGPCLPKDLANLIDCLGTDAVVCAAALARNTVDRCK